MANGILSLIQPGGSSGDKYNMRSEALFHFNIATTATSPTSGEVGKDSSNNLVFVHDNIVSVPIGMIISFISPISVSTPKVYIKNNSSLLNTTAISITDTNGDAGLIANRWYIIVYDGSNFRVVNSHISTNISDNNNQPASTSAVKTYVDGLISNRFKYTISNSTGTTPNTTKYNGSAGTLAPSANTEYIIYLVKHDHMTNDVYDEWITIKNGSTYSWEKIGNTDMDISGLLANIKEHKFTPEGTVSKPTFTGSKATSTAAGGHSHTVTAKGSVSSSFTGTQATLSGATTGHTHSIAASKISVSSSYTPAGTVSGKFTGTQATTSAVDNHTHSIDAETITSTGSYKPTGTVSKPSFNGTGATISSTLEEDYTLNSVDGHTHSIPAITSTGSFTPSGTVSSKFTGTAGDVSVTSTSATITSSGAHTHSIPATKISVSSSYTPEGTVTAPTVTLKNNSFSIINSVGTASSYTVSGEVLTLNASTTPTTKTQIVSVQSVSTPTFTGTNKTITSTNASDVNITSSGSHTHTVPALTSTGTFTPTGTISSSFTGTASTVSVQNTATNTGNGGGHNHKISKETFAVKASYTPAGSVTQPTFTGDSKTVTVKNAAVTTSGAGGHSHTVTATGNLSNLAFSGTQATITSTNSTAVDTNSATDSISITYTPTGSVSSTFTGTSATTNTVTDHTHDVTANGNVSQPTFSGVEVTLPHEQDN